MTTNPPAGEQLGIHVQPIDAEIAVIAVAGEFDGAVAPMLKECIEHVIEGGHRRLVVDLTAAAVFDSISIAVLIGAWMRLRGTGSLVIAAGESGAGRTLRAAGVHMTVATFASAEAALAAIRRGAAI